jgi:hypothetical protein
MCTWIIHVPYMDWRTESRIKRFALIGMQFMVTMWMKSERKNEGNRSSRSQERTTMMSCIDCVLLSLITTYTIMFVLLYQYIASLDYVVSW